MFINLKEAGSSDVKGGSSTSALSQQSGRSAVSDLQFADMPASLHSGKYCPPWLSGFGVWFRVGEQESVVSQAS